MNCIRLWAVQKYIQIHTHLPIYLSIYLAIYLSVYLCMYTCVYMYVMYVCMHTYIHTVHTHINKYTYIHTYIQRQNSHTALSSEVQTPPVTCATCAVVVAEQKSLQPPQSARQWLLTSPVHRCNKQAGRQSVVMGSSPQGVVLEAGGGRPLRLNHRTAALTCLYRWKDVHVVLDLL